MAAPVQQKQRIVERPAHVEALFQLGASAQRDNQSAVEWSLRALAVDPRHAEAAANAAPALSDRGQHVRAMRMLRRAIAGEPGFLSAHGNLGLELLRLEEFEKAIRTLRRLKRLAGDDPQSTVNLGAALDGAGMKAEAQVNYRATAATTPQFAQALYNEAVLAQSRGDVDRALLLFRRTLAIAPRDARAHSNLVFALAYRADRGNRRRALEARRWADRHERARKLPFVASRSDRDRRLRIGYLSSDLRDHPVARNVEELIGRHCRSAFEIFLYSATPGTDQVTSRLRRSADLWRDVLRLSDSDIAALVRQDRIDILVLLAGHTGDNRPGVAAYRPAPIIVSAHDLGTSGIPEIGYWLTDPVLHPLDTPEPFTETLVRLPCFYLQMPPTESPPIVAKAPGRDFVLFVSANNPAKLSPETIAVWARILGSVPRARLQLKYLEAFADPETRGYVERAFRKHGIASDRLVFSYGRTGRSDHLNMIGAGDVALDPFPFNGSTTTFEALWMGLPVVSLAGSCFVGRVGASLLAAVGLSELVAPDEAAYVDIARELANDAARLSALRAELRSRVAASPLCRADDYTRSVERAYREMWRSWCIEGRDR